VKQLELFTDKGMTYEAAAHAVQSGVCIDMERKGIDTDSPMGKYAKHLRVGIDMAHGSQGALAALLADKGVITREEYEEYVRVLANNEVHLYEQRLSRETNSNIKLA
jgi:hypothetical protein